MRKILAQAGGVHRETNLLEQSSWNYCLKLMLIESKCCSASGTRCCCYKTSDN